MLDLILRGGRLIDGSGGPAETGDVAIDAGRIVEVGGRCERAARREIDFDGALVTPGFLDIHTHYDAQIHWDPLVSPSSEHGVTTVVIGNCGLGLAPVHPADRGALQGLLGGVEDIPRECLDAGLAFGWQEYPEYLAAIESMPRAVDVGTLVGHGALRIHALGHERAIREPAAADEIQTMVRQLERAMQAGALGLSSSRSRSDRDDRGQPTPSCFAKDEETHALAGVLAALGEGLIELSFRGSAGDEPERLGEELAWMSRLAEVSGRMVTFGLAQLDAAPDAWRTAYAAATSAAERGLDLRPQTLGRMQSVLLGLDAVHPFAYRPSYRALAELPVSARAERLREPGLRRRILEEESGPVPAADPFAALFSFDPDRIFPLEDPPDYEPGPEKSLASLARQQGLLPLEMLYDLLLEERGERLLLYAVANYHGGDLDASREMVAHPASILGLGDGGAHYGLICDASVQTFLLTHWARDRKRGPGFPLEWLVHKLTAEPASLFGLHDRGRLQPGLRADLNVIDFANLGLAPPRLVRDLPAGAKRFVQSARGYERTIVAGEVTREDGRDTGARPGRLARRVAR